MELHASEKLGRRIDVVNEGSKKADATQNLDRSAVYDFVEPH